MSFVASVAVIIAILLFIKLNRKRMQAGIRGWVISQDLDCKNSRVYRDIHTGISCKPDVVEHDRVIEYKSAFAKDKARYEDILQLAVQMMATGRKEAELRYGNGRRFAFTKDMSIIRSAMRKAEAITGRMRWHLRSGIPPKGMPAPKKCAVCFLKRECPESAVN